MIQIQSTNVLSKILGLFGNRVNCIEIAGECIKFPRSRQNEINIFDISTTPTTMNGLIFATIYIPLKSGQLIKSVGMSKNQAKLFVKHLDSNWQTAILGRFEHAKPSFEQLKKVLDRLENPQKYPAALNVLPYLNEAKALTALLPTPLPKNMFNQTDLNWIQKIFNFIENANELRKQGIEKYITNELARAKVFFDKFESNPLTDEQRTAIITDEDSTLVLASAGSGKTSVITAKVAHLLKNKLSQAGQVLVLAFARNAASEMKERIQRKIGQNVNVTTFHALGYDIIQSVEGKKPALVAYASDEQGLRNHLKDIIQTHLIKLKPIHKLLIKWFSEFMIPYRSEWDFKTLDEYYTFVENKNYRTLKGHLVKGYEELVIANWLFTNGINFEYEATYKHEIPENDRREYQPDFFLPEYGIYIEHWGVRWNIDQNGKKILKTSPGRNQEEYLKGMEWKRAIHNRYDTKLVETYSYEFKEKKLTELLEEKLAKHNVFPQPVSMDIIMENLNSLGLVDKFTDILAVFLRHFKSTGISIEDCKASISANNANDRNLVFLKIFEPLFEEYQVRLGSNIDFEDMINRATEHVKSGQYISSFRHILVDEFQDISGSRANLLLALKKQRTDTKVFVVGDDWQSIYRFSGSDLSLVRKFGEMFGGKFDDQVAFKSVNLTYTFRSTDKIAQAARRFILKNPFQIKKSIQSTLISPQQAIFVEFYEKGERNELLQQVLSRIEKNFAKNSTNSVLLLGRYHINEPKNLTKLKTTYPNLKLDFKTVHASKGLEADYVILLDVNKQSFPSEITDDPILDLVLPVPEKYEYAEERRLFYVAITRAKYSVTILANKYSPSCFVQELINSPEYGIEGIDRKNEKAVKCPTCSGEMQMNYARNGNTYFICRHQQLCNTFIISCPNCKLDLPTKQLHSDNYICSCGEKFLACPECSSGWLVTRTSKYGDFLGCINFPQCKGKSKSFESN